VGGRRKSVSAAPEGETDAEVWLEMKVLCGMCCCDGLQGCEATGFVDAPNELCFGVCSRQSRWTGPKATTLNYRFESLDSMSSHTLPPFLFFLYTKVCNMCGYIDAQQS
jgi:hypothetical protein